MMSSDATAFDSVLDSCQNQHRRIVLRTVAEEQRPVTLDELTEIVFRHTHQTPFTEASEDVLTRIRLSLYQAHLPKLASKGLINYDSERQLVEPIEQGEQVQETLSTIRDADPSLEAPIELYHQTYHYHGDDELEQCFEHLFRPRRRTTEIP